MGRGGDASHSMKQNQSLASVWEEGAIYPHLGRSKVTLRLAPVRAHHSSYKASEVKNSGEYLQLALSCRGYH